MSDVIKIDPKEVGDAIKGDILSQLQGELDAQAEKALKAAMRRLETDPTFQRRGFITPDGGTADPEIKGFGDFLVALSRKDEKRLREHYKSVPLEEADGAKALSEGSGPAGGWTVPTQMETNLLEIAADTCVVDKLSGPRAPMNLPMKAAELSLPALDYSQAPSSGQTAMEAGVYARWTEEAGTIQETEPRFRALTMRARKLAGYTVASAELESDSAIALERLLTRLFGQAIGRRRGHAFMRGDGVGKPLGIANSPAAYKFPRTSSGADVELADVLAMYNRLLPASQQRAVWVAHPFLMSQLAVLSMGSNNAMNWGDIRTGIPDTFLGKPIYWDEFMSAPGTEFDLALVDWSFYIVGQRAQTAISMSEHVRFTTDEKVWRFTHRVAGQPWIDTQITLGDGAGTNKVSPFVILQ